MGKVNNPNNPSLCNLFYIRVVCILEHSKPFLTVTYSPHVIRLLFEYLAKSTITNLGVSHGPLPPLTAAAYGWFRDITHARAPRLAFKRLPARQPQKKCLLSDLSNCTSHLASCVLCLMLTYYITLFSVDA